MLGRGSRGLTGLTTKLSVDCHFYGASVRLQFSICKAFLMYSQLIFRCLVQSVFGLKTSAFYSYLIFLTCGLLFKWLQTSGIDISPDIGMKVNFIQFMPNTISLRNWQDFHISLTIPLHCCVDIDSFVRCAKGKILSKMARPSWLLLCLFWIGGGGGIFWYSQNVTSQSFFEWVSVCLCVCVCLSVWMGENVF